MFKKIENNIWEFDSQKEGKNICIMGSVHGNEPVGADTIKHILKNSRDFVPSQGKLTLIIGNPQALAESVRFIDEDLNRLARNSREILIKKETVESIRMLEIMDFIKSSDYLLDIHATQNPSDKTFTYSEGTRSHQNIYRVINTDIHIEQGIPAKKRTLESISSFDNLVDNNGGIGVTLEAGYCYDTTKVPWTLQQVKNVINKICGIGVKESSGDIYTLKKEIIPNSNSFKFTKNYINFDKIPRNFVYAKDGESKLQEKNDSIMIFPKSSYKKGKAAGYLARKN